MAILGNTEKQFDSGFYSVSNINLLTQYILCITHLPQMAAVIKSDTRVNRCDCGGGFTSIKTELFQNRIPACLSCGKPPKLLKIRVNLPKIGRYDIRYNRVGQRLTSLALADALLDEILKDIRTDRFDIKKYFSSFQRRQYLIGTLLDQYIDEKRTYRGQKSGCTPKYIKDTDNLIKNYLKPFFGKIDSRELHYNHLKQFMAAKEFPSHRQKVKALGVLRPTLKMAAKELVGISLPEFPPLPASRMKTNFRDFETVMKIFDKMTTYRDAAKTGIIYILRPCEIRAIQLRDINLTKGTLTIQRHWSDDMILDGRKSASDPSDRYYRIELPVVPEFGKILARYDLSGDPKSFLFERKYGGPLAVGSLNKQWRKACLLADVPVRAFYDDVRHGGATQLINAGVPLDKIRALCGHTNSSTTQRYAESDTLALTNVITKARYRAQQGLQI